jgi:hypothetical protein
MEAGNGGLTRCDCQRGRALTLAQDQAKKREYHAPAISTEDAMTCMEMMSGMDYFPTQAPPQAVIANEFGAMCHSLEQGIWLAAKMIRKYDKWPGVPELRRVFCAEHIPLDGIPDTGISEVYPDGIPSDRPPEESRRLPGTRDPLRISGAQSVDETMRDLVVKTDLNRQTAPKRVRDIPIRPPWTPEERKDWEEKTREAEEQVRAQKEIEKEP